MHGRNDVVLRTACVEDGVELSLVRSGAIGGIRKWHIQVKEILGTCVWI